MDSSDDRKGSIIPQSSQGKKRSEKILRKRNLDSFAMPFESQESSQDSEGSKKHSQNRGSEERAGSSSGEKQRQLEESKS
jgi:hypothetical protein